jgi:hypothetical protein
MLKDKINFQSRAILIKLISIASYTLIKEIMVLVVDV